MWHETDQSARSDDVERTLHEWLTTSELDPISDIGGYQRNGVDAGF